MMRFRGGQEPDACLSRVNRWLRLVPSDVQADIELFIRGGLGILDKITAIDYNVWHQRPVLKKWEKAALLGGVLWRRIKVILDFRF